MLLNALVSLGEVAVAPLRSSQMHCLGLVGTGSTPNVNSVHERGLPSLSLTAVGHFCMVASEAMRVPRPRGPSSIKRFPICIVPTQKQNSRSRAAQMKVRRLLLLLLLLLPPEWKGVGRSDGSKLI